MRGLSGMTTFTLIFTVGWSHSTPSFKVSRHTQGSLQSWMWLSLSPGALPARSEDFAYLNAMVLLSLNSQLSGLTGTWNGNGDNAHHAFSPAGTCLWIPGPSVWVEVLTALEPGIDKRRSQAAWKRHDTCWSQRLEEAGWLISWAGFNNFYLTFFHGRSPGQTLLRPLLHTEANGRVGGRLRESHMAERLDWEKLA